MENIEAVIKDGVDLSRGNFSGADFGSHNLRRARFAKCDFTDANLCEANLGLADLREAVLIGADLTSADLYDANLTGADLTNALLDGAAIEAAILVDCIGIVDAGTDRRGYRFIGVKHSDGWRVKAGCRWYTLTEARQHWEDDGNEDALERVALIAASE